MSEIKPPDASTSNQPLEDSAKVVIIGGGVVGCSILFHLAKLGWKDVILLERSELTSGSSWHAAGQIHTISSDPNISRLQSYTINLYKEIEEVSGHNIGMHNTGGFYLAANQDWYDYLKRERSKARVAGLDQEFISLEEVSRRHPLIDPSHYIAALWDPLDGDVDPSGVTYAYAKAARVHGAKYHTHCRVIETLQRNDGSWDVVTPKGTIHAEMIVNAGGLWAREVGHLAGLHLPVQPMEHHYLITEDIAEIVERDERLPAGIDYEGNIYFRQERHGMLLGTYEQRATPWSVEHTPPDFGHELLPTQLDHIADRLEVGFSRIPALQQAGIKNIINGPFTFGPDGNPLIGPVPGMRNYWVAVGVMAGFCQAGGVGLCMAEWMIEGEPSIDVWAMDVARFGDYATPQWGRVKATENYQRRFVMTFPNETLPEGRQQKTTALYDRFIAKGAVMGEGHGLEFPLWFADNLADAHEKPTFRRSRAHAYIKREVAAVRQHVGVIEIANFAKHEVKGVGAKQFLERLLAGRIPKPGRMALSPMLTDKGKLYGDFTIACLGAEHYMLFGSGAAQNMHRRWFEAHLQNQSGVIYENRSDAWHGLAISGPKSRDLLAKLCKKDVSNAGFSFLDICWTDVGGVPAILARLSFSGELGYEIYVAPHYQLRLYQALCAAGADLGLRDYGARAMMSMRLEKNWGAWGLDFRPDFTAEQAGLAPFIDFSRDFIGSRAAMAEHKAGPSQRLITLIIDTDDSDVTGDEAILKDGEVAGYISSGGYAHHLGKSLAMGYVPTRLAREGMTFEVEIIGVFCPAIMVGRPLYDPAGEKMRG